MNPARDVLSLNPIPLRFSRRHRSIKKELSRPISRVLYYTIIYLGCISLYTSSHLPGRCRADLASSIRCCSGWGLHLQSVARLPVSSYLAFPPLLISERYISVALSLESPPQGVTLHPALRSSDFPHAQDYSLCPQSYGLLS